jgi:hypothetical protein
VIVYSPMASRLLTGAFSAERAAHLETGDWPAGNPGFTGRALSANLALAEALRPVAQQYGFASAAVAIAWTRASLGVTRRSWGPAARADRGWLPAATLEVRSTALPKSLRPSTPPGPRRSPPYLLSWRFLAVREYQLGAARGVAE